VFKDYLRPVARLLATDIRRSRMTLQLAPMGPKNQTKGQRAV